MYRKNVASQNLPFVLIKATDGTALTGATVTARRSIDGGAQASATGTVSELANGQYNLALSQADTNGNQIGILLTATGAIPVHFSIVTTAADPTDATAFGISRLDAAVTSRLAPTTAGRTLDVAATGEAGLDFDNIKDATGAHTLTNIRVPNVTLTDTLTTYTGNTPQTGDAFARLGAPAGASVSADIAGVQADTDNIQTRIPAALVSGRIDASVGAYPGNTAQTGDAFARLGAPVGASISADVAGVQADTDNIQTRLPAALVSGRIDASVGAMATNTLTAAAFAADAGAEIADAVWDEARGGHTTAGTYGEGVSSVQGAVTGAVASVTAGVTVTTNSDKTGYALTSGERDSIASNLFKFDFSAITGEASRSLLNAVRVLRNRFGISGSTRTVYKEDDTTAAWTSTISTSGSANPIVGDDPVG